MFHQHIPVRTSSGETCCGSCGQVLENVMELSHEYKSFGVIESGPGLDSMMLGTSFAKVGFWQDPSNKDLRNKEMVGKKLVDICKEFHISERIAYETMRRMLKENRGFYSSHKQIQMLCQTIKDSNDVRSILCIGKIREKYDKVTGV